MALTKKTRNYIFIAIVAVVAIAVAAAVFVNLSKPAGSGANQTASSTDASEDSAQAANDFGGLETYTLEDGTVLPVVHAWTHPGSDASPYVIGDELGFFHDAGVHVEFTGVIDYDQYLPSVLDGTNDVGDAHPNQLATYIKEGAPVKAVCRMDIDAVDPANATHRHMRYYVRADSPIKTWADLADYNNGGEIIINGHDPSCTSFVPNTIFEKNGLDRERITYIYFGDAEALQALDLGDIDIAQVHPAYYDLADKGGYRLIGDSVDSGVGAASGTALYFFTEEFIAAHPDVVQSFVNGITLAQAWIDEPKNWEEAARLTGEATGLDVVYTHYFSGSTEIIDEDIQFWIDELERGGYLKEDELTVDDLVTKQFYNPEIDWPDLSKSTK
ncbi:MAG: ABC transporter substrate-binding protein [Coriobacteriales bacterium]|jgi:ABC-type nitrate/sulfonate/bicarbonate transport system substrate-binding protein|nr:ABC transporter substrate-binding protein [Coriobacteriales bacterium]